jgi:hypothetical protein
MNSLNHSRSYCETGELIRAILSESVGQNKGYRSLVLPLNKWAVYRLS